MNLYNTPDNIALIEDDDEEFEEQLPAAIAELVETWDNQYATELSYLDSQPTQKRK